MILRSIKSRLLLSLTVFVALSLGVSGFALDRSFRNSVETALQQKLKANFYSLLAVADAEKGELMMPELLPDPLFNRIESGLYAIIKNQLDEELWRSPSAITLSSLPTTAARLGQFRFDGPVSSQKKGYYQLSYALIWELENGEERHYHIYLLQGAQAAMSEIAEFRSSLWRWFGAIGIILLFIQGSIMHWGLKPLRKLASDLQAIENGQQEQLTDNYPSELQNVTQNLNILIDNERRQRQRYRDTLADLAHSLKTPLAVLRGLNSNTSINTPDNKHNIDEQITRMDDIVSHQLHRASNKTPNTTSTLSMQPVALAPLTDKLLRSLSKVYADNQITSHNLIPADLTLRADEGDLLEVFGNLLDNAFKASAKQVVISVQSSNLKTLLISIEDDGPGIAEQQRQTVLQRGGRADTQHPGQGIGLTVAQDILNSYQAQLQIESSKLGGAKILIEFPRT